MKTYIFLSEILLIVEVRKIIDECNILLESRISYGPRQRSILAKAAKKISTYQNKIRVHRAKLIKPGSFKSGKMGGASVFKDTGWGLVDPVLQRYAKAAQKIKGIIQKIQDEAIKGIKY